MLQIKSHQFQVTEAMREVVTHQFNFLTPKELNHLQLKVESLNPHHLQIKIIYQQPRQKPLVIEILTEDFYKGIDQLSKKMQVILRKQDKKIRRRQDKISLGLALSEIESMDQDDNQTEIKEIEIPIYRLTQSEAIKQLELCDKNILMYYDLNLDLICTLVKEGDGSIKQYIGIN